SLGQRKGGMAAIRVRDLHKSYGSVEAVSGIDFEVAEGEVFGFLGPNGAGKTTTVEILEGYRSASSGDVDVLGHDPARGERAFRQRIGIVLQEAGIDRYLKVAEVLELYGGYYPRPRTLGKTVFLTTHYMDEAQELADRVAVIAQGRIVAEGAPASLGGRDAATEIRFILADRSEAADLPDLSPAAVAVDGEWIQVTAD